MSYGDCSVVCWKRLFTSIVTFYERLVSKFLNSVRNCWKNTYRHCTENCDCWFCWCRVKAIFCIAWQTIVNIFCTVVQVLIVIVSIIFYIVFFVLTIVRCIILPCAIGSHKAPSISTCDDLFSNLRSEVNDELTWYDKLFGAVFTPAKETGFSNAWDQYDLWMEARGTVIHNAYSTDGLETIDIKLLSLIAFDNESYSGTPKCSWPEIDGEKYIRAEVFPQVLVFYLGAEPQVGNTVLVKGRLYWDRDGFLEIHPQHGGDLRILP
jgi:hypothetical protein